MGTRDWRGISINEIQFERKELQSQLIPVLRKSMLNNGFDWFTWTNQLLETCKKALSKLFPLQENEKEFLDKLYNHGVLEATLITSDPNTIQIIDAHPLLKWKTQLIAKNKK